MKSVTQVTWNPELPTIEAGGKPSSCYTSPECPRPRTEESSMSARTTVALLAAISLLGVSGCGPEADEEQLHTEQSELTVKKQCLPGGHGYWLESGAWSISLSACTSFLRGCGYKGTVGTFNGLSVIEIQSLKYTLCNK